MKKALIFLFLVIITAGVALSAPVKKDPFNIQIKQLYSAPDEESNLIYNIPITVALLDVSPDGNWHKVVISFSLGPLGYTYVGWTRIPVGEILAARNEKVKVAKAPALSKDQEE